MKLITILILAVIYLVCLRFRDHEHVRWIATVITSIFMWYGVWVCCDWYKKINGLDDENLSSAAMFIVPALFFSTIYPTDLLSPRTIAASVAYHF